MTTFVSGIYTQDLQLRGTFGINFAMIMDGLDTLSQVALADQLNLSFDVYNPPATTGGVTATTSLPGPEGLAARGLLLEEPDSLHTPVTTSSDVNFSFVSSEFEISQEAFPITGESNLNHYRWRHTLRENIPVSLLSLTSNLSDTSVLDNCQALLPRCSPLS